MADGLEPLGSVNIPNNSDINDQNAISDVINTPIYRLNILCLYDSCNFHTTDEKLIKKHLKAQHIDWSQPCTQNTTLIDDIPELKNTHIGVLDNGRAICKSSLVFLRSEEIPQHIYSCLGCSNFLDKDSRDRIVYPELVNLDNEAFDVFYDKPLVGVDFENDVISYKEHQPFKRAEDIEPETRRVKKSSWIDKIKNKHSVEYELYGKPINKLPRKEISKSTLFTGLVTEAMRQIIICTGNRHRGVIQRFDSFALVDYKEDNWFGDLVEQQVPYNLKEAVEIEAFLANVKLHDLDSKEGEDCRHKISSYICGLLTLLSIKEIDCQNYSYRFRGEERNLNLVDGRLYLQNIQLPWCVAEIISQYLLFVRPIQKEHDDIVHDKLLTVYYSDWEKLAKEKFYIDSLDDFKKNENINYDRISSAIYRSEHQTIRQQAFVLPFYTIS